MTTTSLDDLLGTTPVAPIDDPGDLPARLLRSPREVAEAILDGQDLQRTITQLVAVTACGAALFGVAVGMQGGIFQALMSGIKLPLVLLGAAGISLPMLHLGVSLSASRAVNRLHPRQLSALVLQALATGAITMAGLAPLIVIVWLTFAAMPGAGLEGSVDSGWFVYRRVVLATVGVAALGGLVGAVRLVRVLPLRALFPWTACFGLAGVQLSWLLRPLVGMPGSELVLVRLPESNGLREILVAIFAVLS